MPLWHLAKVEEARPRPKMSEETKKRLREARAVPVPPDFAARFPVTPTKVLAAEYRVTPSAVAKMAQRMGLLKAPDYRPDRTPSPEGRVRMSEASLSWWSDPDHRARRGQLTREMWADEKTRRHMTQRISDVASKNFMERPGMWANRFKNINSGVREDTGDIWFRSGWEHNIYLYFQHLKDGGLIRDFGYETHRLPYTKPRAKTSHFYIPDFTILTSDGETVHTEIKGYFSQEDRRKMKYVIEQNPDAKIALMTAPFYRAVERDYAHLIPGWERPGQVIL